MSNTIRVMVLIAAASAVGTSLLEVKSPRGIDFILQNSPTSRKYLIETMPGGVALLDYNNDGLLDIFLVNGGHIDSAMQTPDTFNRHDARYWNRLYRQNRDGSFTDVTAEAGLANAGDGNYGMGVAVGDYDNDGYPDLYVTSYGKNVLYHNNGDGTFTDVTAKAGVAGGGWSVSAGFFDYDNDGKLDLFVTRYMEWDTKHSKDGGGNYHTYCPPGEFPRTTNILYHNRGDGTFEDVSERSGIAAKKGHGLGVAFADYNGDGLTDIYVANDGMQQYLFRNNGNGTFKEVGMEAGAALNLDGGPLSGMGVVFQDYDNDGRPDVIVTTLPRQTYAVFHNEGNGTFSDQGLQTGVTMLSGVTSGWGVSADAVFYIQGGKVQLNVVSKIGKEATLGILGGGDFFGEGSLAGQALRMGSAMALTDCELLRIEKKAMINALHREHAFSDLFVAYLLARNIRYEEDLVDQLFNSSEKRLARVLLLLAHFGKEGVPETVVPKISQETLAEMVGTTRSRVSFFMNRFRKLGFIQYNGGLEGGLQVHSSLLNIVLHD